MSITATTADNFPALSGLSFRFSTTGKTDEATVGIDHNPAEVQESYRWL